MKTQILYCFSYALKTEWKMFSKNMLTKKWFLSFQLLVVYLTCKTTMMVSKLFLGRDYYGLSAMTHTTTVLKYEATSDDVGIVLADCYGCGFSHDRIFVWLDPHTSPCSQPFHHCVGSRLIMNRWFIRIRDRSLMASTGPDLWVEAPRGRGHRISDRPPHCGPSGGCSRYRRGGRGRAPWSVSRPWSSSMTVFLSNSCGFLCLLLLPSWLMMMMLLRLKCVDVPIW